MPRTKQPKPEPRVERSELYGGRVVIDFRPDARKNRYVVTVDGEDRGKVASVTQITSVYDKSGPLINWAVKESLDIVRRCIGAGATYSQAELDGILETARKRSHKLKKEAADIGTLAHSWCEKYFTGQNPPLPDKDATYRPCVDAALDWASKHKIRFLHSERAIYSIKHNYSGRLDGIAESDGVLSLIDFKTGNSVYCDHLFQVAAYNVAYEEEGGPELQKRWIIRLGKEDGKFHRCECGRASLNRDFSAFLGLKQAFEAGKEIGKELRQVEAASDDWLAELTQ